MCIRDSPSRASSLKTINEGTRFVDITSQDSPEYPVFPSHKSFSMSSSCHTAAGGTLPDSMSNVLVPPSITFDAAGGELHTLPEPQAPSGENQYFEVQPHALRPLQRPRLPDEVITYTNANMLVGVDTAPTADVDYVNKEPIRFGSDCSGMEIPAEALLNLRVNFEHTFASDNDKECQRTLDANWPDIKECYSDLTSRDNTRAPPVDLYMAGFPCQPFSRAGKQEGFADSKGRGTIFFHILEYINEQKPQVFILENVKAITTIDNGSCLKTILRLLQSAADGMYKISHEILNTCHHGLPHSRPRWYCVGIKRSLLSRPFQFPTPLRNCMSINDLMDDLPKEKIPRTAHVASNIRNALAHVRKLGENPQSEPYVVDVDASDRKSQVIKNLSPCITRSRCDGHWLLHRQRRMTPCEMLRLQGVDPTTFRQNVSDRSLGQQVGNAMSVNVVERLLYEVFRQTNLVPMNQKDRWVTGAAQAALRDTIGKPIGSELDPLSSTSYLWNPERASGTSHCGRTIIDGHFSGLGSDQANLFLCQGAASAIILDSGATHHAMSESCMTEEEVKSVYELENHIRLFTGNGTRIIKHGVRVHVPFLNRTITALFIPNSTPLLSMGQLVEDDFSIGWDKEDGQSNCTITDKRSGQVSKCMLKLCLLYTSDAADE